MAVLGVFSFDLVAITVHNVDNGAAVGEDIVEDLANRLKLSAGGITKVNYKLIASTLYKLVKCFLELLGRSCVKACDLDYCNRFVKRVYVRHNGDFLDLFTADSEFHLFAVVITAEYGKYSNRANLAAKLIDSGIIAKLGNKLFFFSYCIDKVAGLNSCFKCGRLRLN